jgi:hypothetical protein
VFGVILIQLAASVAVLQFLLGFSSANPSGGTACIDITRASGRMHMAIRYAVLASWVLSLQLAEALQKDPAQFADIVAAIPTAFEHILMVRLPVVMQSG